jgi:hypothetical protein
MKRNPAHLAGSVSAPFMKNYLLIKTRGCRQKMRFSGWGSNQPLQAELRLSINSH